MLKIIIKKIENSPMSFGQGVFLVYIASFLRGFLETFANSDNQNRLMGAIDTFFHYPLWFSGLFLFIIIILKILTGERIEKISKAGTFFSFLIILAPIIDLVANKGHQARYAFLVGNFSDLIKSFLNFLDSIGKSPGATIGMKIEIVAALIFIGYYVFHKTRKVFRSAAGIAIAYFLIFLFAILPVIILGIYNLAVNNEQPLTYKSINNFYYEQEPSSALGFDKTFVLDRNNYESPKTQDIKNQYSITISAALALICALLLGWWFYLYDKKKFFSAVKNMRFLRIAHYFLMIGVGIGTGIIYAGHNPVNSLFDALSFLLLFLSFVFAALFCIWENDRFDIGIDKISNKDRPLIRDIFSVEEWKSMEYFFLFLSLNFSFLLGLYQFIFNLLFILIYHIYSAPPLRLKRFPAISSFLIAANALVAVWMGFFMSAGTENFKAFPPKYIFGILIIFFLAENVKNLKDIKGDKENNIKTLPVILGEKRGRLVIGGLCFLSAILTPAIFFANAYTLVTSLIFGFILFFFVTRKDFKEKYVFIAYFIFAAVFIFEIFMLNYRTILPPLSQRTENSAHQGWIWLKKYDKKMLDPVIPLIIKTINEKYCHSAEADYFWKEKSKEFESHYYLSVFERFFSGSEKYKISEKVVNILSTPQKRYNDALAQALYCDLYPVREDFVKNNFDGIENETGYDLTHKFWSAILAKNNKCLGENYNIGQIIAKAVEKIEKEQESSDKFDDLYAERAAFLASFGFKEKISISWIKKILESQLESGAWATPINSGKYLENPHTTALSIWTLAEYSQKCPF